MDASILTGLLAVGFGLTGYSNIKTNGGSLTGIMQLFFCVVMVVLTASYNPIALIVFGVIGAICVIIFQFIFLPKMQERKIIDARKAEIDRALTDTEEKILNLCKRYLSVVDLSGMQVHPDISNQRLNNAREKYIYLQDDDIVLALYDYTLINSGKKGLAITSRGFYWSTDHKGYLQFKNASIKELKYSNGMFTLNDEEFHLGASVGIEKLGENLKKLLQAMSNEGIITANAKKD